MSIADPYYSRIHYERRGFKFGHNWELIPGYQYPLSALNVGDRGEFSFRMYRSGSIRFVVKDKKDETTTVEWTQPLAQTEKIRWVENDPTVIYVPPPASTTKVVETKQFFVSDSSFVGMDQKKFDGCWSVARQRHVLPHGNGEVVCNPESCLGCIARKTGRPIEKKPVEKPTQVVEKTPDPPTRFNLLEID